MVRVMVYILYHSPTLLTEHALIELMDRNSNATVAQHITTIQDMVYYGYGNGTYTVSQPHSLN